MRSQKTKQPSGIDLSKSLKDKYNGQLILTREFQQKKQKKQLKYDSQQLVKVPIMISQQSMTKSNQYLANSKQYPIICNQFSRLYEHIRWCIRSNPNHFDIDVGDVLKEISSNKQEVNMYRFLSELWEGENAGVKLYSVLRKRLETTVCTENEIFSFEIIFFSYIATILKKHQITIQNTLRSLIRQTYFTPESYPIFSQSKYIRLINQEQQNKEDKLHMPDKYWSCQRQLQNELLRISKIGIPIIKNICAFGKIQNEENLTSERANDLVIDFNASNKMLDQGYPPSIQIENANRSLSQPTPRPFDGKGKDIIQKKPNKIMRENEKAIQIEKHINPLTDTGAPKPIPLIPKNVIGQASIKEKLIFSEAEDDGCQESNHGNYDD